MPPQVEFADHNVPDLNTMLPAAYTHTEFFRKFVGRGKPDPNDPSRILVEVKEGQKLYQPADRKVKL